MGGTFIPASKKDAENIKEFNKNCIYEIDIKVAKRSNQQNRAYWQWCNMIATTLNKENKEISYVIKLSDFWNKDLVHESITKAILKDKFNKDSTTKLNKNELDLFIDEVVLWLGENGVVAPEFPTNLEK